MSNSDNNNNKPTGSGDSQQATTDQTETGVDFHEAAVIDENGNAIPITEEMVQEACAELEKSRESNPDSDHSA